MRTIADHIYDIAMNSVKAGSKNVYLTIKEESKKNEIYFSVKDDGCGIPAEKVETVFNPFYTTRDKKIRKVGLGLPLLKQNSEMTGGYAKLSSEIGKGTFTEALFKNDSVDAVEKGNIADSIHGLVVSSDEIEWHIILEKDGISEEISTLEIKDILGGVSFKNVEVIKALKGVFEELFKNMEM